MFKRIKSFFDVSHQYKEIAFYTNKEEEDAKSKAVIYFGCAIAAFILSIFNYIDGYKEMLVMTLILTAGMLLASAVNKFLKKFLLADAIAAILGAGIFSTFALSGANDGFAILWILILPPIMTSINKKVGILLSLYILIFVFTICYTPIKGDLTGYYTKTFLERFPLLCATDFLIITYIWAQSSFSERELALKTYGDELTGIYNRSFFRVVSEYIEKHDLVNKVTFISMDVNGLKITNDELGHLAGDELIKGAASIIDTIFSSNSYGVFRIGGDEFVALLKCDRSEIPTYERKLLEAQKAWSGNLVKTISISHGFASAADYPGKDLEYLYKIADEMMLINKTKYYVENKIDRRHSERRGKDRRIEDILNGKD